MDRYCEHCGAAAQKGQLYCKNCGNSLRFDGDDLEALLYQQKSKRGVPEMNKNCESKASKGISTVKLSYLFVISVFIISVLVMIIGVVVEADAPACLIFIVAYFVVSFLILKHGEKTACPRCAKAFAMVEVKRNVIDSRNSTIDVERTVRDRQGRVIRRYTEAIPATQYLYDCTDRCKYCGHTRNVNRDEKVRS